MLQCIAINTNVCTLDRFRSKSSRITAGKIDNCSRDKICILFNECYCFNTQPIKYIHRNSRNEKLLCQTKWIFFETFALTTGAIYERIQHS